jgi:hypothetical protein
MADDLQQLALVASMASSSMPSDVVTKIEAAVAADPSNREARAELLGWYQRSQYNDERVREQRAEHIVWFIEHAPEDAFTGSPWCSMHDDDPKFSIVRKK